MKKCPKCGFEIEDDLKKCPNCKAELKQDKSELDKETTKNASSSFTEEENDDITWSDYSDVPIGSVIEELESLQDEKTEEQDEEKTEEYVSEETKVTKEEQESTTQDSLKTESSILESYIKDHKENDDFEEKDPQQDPAINQTIEKEDKKEDHSEEVINSEAVVSSSEEKTDQKASSTRQEDSFAEHEKSPKHKARRYVITAAAILLVGAGTWGYMDHQKKIEAARQEELRIDKALQTIDNEVNGFYVDGNQQFIKADKTASELSDLVSQLEQYKNEPEYEDIAAEAQKVQLRLAVIDEINSQFTQPILIEDSLDEKAHLKEDSTMDMALLDSEDDFSTLANQAIQTGKDEYQTLQKTKQSVDSLLANYKKGKLADSVSRSDIESTEKQIALLSNEDQKESLTESIKPLKTALSKREAEEKKAKQVAQQKAEEEKKDLEQQAAAAASKAQPVVTENSAQEILSRSTPTNRNNQPIISSRQSDINDTNNPAWSFAEGVYDQVINECIKRGYIVSGGFTLEPVRIENGEGYYNLYATNTKSSLMKGISEKALPMYLVTINCKTGFFRGNASGT